VQKYAFFHKKLPIQKKALSLQRFSGIETAE
jgi:hypothetical protein